MLYECAHNEEGKENEAVNEINIYKQSPNKVYLITINDKKRLDEANRIKLKFHHIKFETVLVEQFDVVGITTTLNKLIQKEKGNQIFINVTEGRKPMFLAGVFAASLNKALVEGAYYLRQDIHELIPIPLMDFALSGKKRIILEELRKGNKNANEIAEKVKVNKSFVYAATKDLIGNRYITKEWDVTDSGKICLMSK